MTQDFDAVVPDTGEIAEVRGGRLSLPGKATAVALLLPESLSQEDWLGIGEQLKGVERSLMWWIGDWLRYGEGRWGEMYSQALDATEHSYGTLANAKSVAEKFSDFSRRRENLPWSFHADASSLDPTSADQVLAHAEEAGLSRSELRSEVHRRKNLIGVQPSGNTCTASDLAALAATGVRFSTIYADPPWLYGNQGTRAATGNHYGGMTVEDIAALPISDLTLPDAHLHLWTTNGFLFESRAIIEAWGFTYKSCFVWVKPSMGIGNYWRVSHEFLLFAVKGTCPFRDRGQMSWMEIPRGEHSRKPDKIRRTIETVSPAPYLELFGREPSQGWTVWGNEIERGLLFKDIPEVA